MFGNKRQCMLYDTNVSILDLEPSSEILKEGERDNGYHPETVEELTLV